MFLNEDLLKTMIQEINDEYLTQLPPDTDTPASSEELAMDAFSAEMEEITLDPNEDIQFMGKRMGYDDFIAILGNYVVTHEQRFSGGGENKLLRKDVRRAIRAGLSEVPQLIANAVAEALEPYLEDNLDQDAEREYYGRNL
jgi:hypothetical protein